MTAHVTEVLFELATGTLTGEDRAGAERHLAACPACSAELAAAESALSALAVALPAEAPRRAARDRLLAAAVGGRFERFADEVARLLDVAGEKARALLDAIDTAAPWVEGPTPAIQLFHLETGPAAEAGIAGFVRVRAGERFPYHRHLGQERVLVLQGGLHDDDGSVLRRGEASLAPAGSAHSFVALPGPDLVYLVVLQVGVDIPGYPSDV